ncbi:ATP-dependent RNA helicase [Terramyces sp. JEL0728]|nr:ATP-dependent RNA helicase [Terramyces sp. JEL0728]
MGKWKSVKTNKFLGAADACFYSLEEITEEELMQEPNPPKKRKFVSAEDIDDELDFSSFIPIDEFKEKEKEKPKKLKKMTEVDIPKEVEPEALNDGELELWKDFNLNPLILSALKTLGYSKPTEIQAQTMKHSIIHHKDIIGAAETGSGKTLAFGLPILNCLAEKDYQSEGVTGLILVPTRELALQVTEHLKKAGANLAKYVVPVVGGMSIEKQNRLISKTPDVIVATPGRLWAIMQSTPELIEKLLKIRFFVLDEADRMLESGHFKDLDEIIAALSISKLNQEENRAIKRQTFIFSATMVESSNLKKKKSKTGTAENALLENLIDKIEFRDKTPIYVNISRKEVTAKGVLESKIDCLKTEKDLMVYYILCRYQGKSIVFVNSIDAIRRLVPILSLLLPSVYGIHAEMQQKQRIKNLERFRDTPNALLIASDVASRGLDIPLVDHVIHYQLPRSAEIYVHRSGRTARGQNNEGVNQIDDFPVDGSITAAMKQRLTLARQLDQLKHKQKKFQNNKDWFKKAAEEADIFMSDESDAEVEQESLERHNRQVQKLQNQLDGLLKVSLIPKGNILPTIALTKATTALKNKKK